MRTLVSVSMYGRSRFSSLDSTQFSIVTKLVCKVAVNLVWLLDLSVFHRRYLTRSLPVVFILERSSFGELPQVEHSF